jgi:hypothetical protein
MTKEQFEGEKNYRVSIIIAKAMLARKIINESDYSKIDIMLISKYKPAIGGL